MKSNRAALALAAAATLAAMPGAAQTADFHHVQITASSPARAVEWYAEHLDCEPVADRDDAAACDGVELVFVPQPTTGGSQGTGVNHIGFSYPDLTAKMAELEAVGVRGTGVRLQRFDDGSMVRDVPGLFKIAFIFDPWGTRIELVEDTERLGFHHIDLSATDPEATLAWYRDVMGGEPATLRGRVDAVAFGDLLLMAAAHPEGAAPASTRGRAIDHLGFVVPDLDAEAPGLRRQGVRFEAEPAVPENARTAAKRAFVSGPDNVRIAVVETGFAGVGGELAAAIRSADALEPYDVPRTSWGEPDLAGIWTGNPSHGIPLERPADVDADELTPEEAIARREDGTLGSIWGYDREWRDVTLSYGHAAVSTQVAMIVDPPDGRLPARTEHGQALYEQVLGNYESRPYAGPENVRPAARCLTRGIPGMMMPTVYNNGLQIVQGPGYVAITKEMIHETRIIPTTERPRLGADLDLWLGDPQGRWEGDTLVVETTNFDDRVASIGRPVWASSSDALTLTERFTRVGPMTLQYEFTIDDPKIWTRPWTAMFRFDRDDSQYELVEYACHEGNYAMTGILSGGRAVEAAAAAEAAR